MIYSLIAMARNMIVPAAVLLLAVWSTRLLQAMSGDVQALIAMAPFAGAALVVAVALLFNQVRSLCIAIMLVGGYVILLRTGTRPDSFQTELLFIAYTCLLPLNLLVLASIKEPGVFNTRGAVLISLLAMQGIALLGLLRSQPEVVRQFLVDWLPAVAGQRLPLAGTGLFIFAALWLGVRLWRQPTPLNAGLLLLLPPVAAAALWGPMPMAPVIFLTAAGVILLLAMLLETHRIAHRDDLTGLLARRALNLRLATLGRCYVIAMVDVDHFKKFNDRHGHDVGDQVLRVVARQLQRVSGGTAYRYGGEEFAIVFPGKDLDFALPQLEEIRKAVADYRLVLRARDRPKRKPAATGPARSGSSQTVKVTISIGAAERGAILRSAEHVLKAADKALYKAKKAGRNRVSA